MKSLLSRLFEKTTMQPQIGFARGDKRALLWLPGKKPIWKGVKKIMEEAPLRGCSQIAYNDWFKVVDNQACEICWIGLDIDQEDNEHVCLAEWALTFATKNPVSFIRTSCSGKGVHMIWILKEPIKCTHEASGGLVKRIAFPKKELVEAEGIHVCQANKRMFWLMGGKNKTIYESVYRLKVDLSEVEYTPKTKCVDPLEEPITKGVQHFANLFKSKGIISSYGRTHRIYIGDAVKALREAGEKVYTKSPCSGNGQVNGYINMLGNTISLWSYADGHVIWNYTDLEGLLK